MLLTYFKGKKWSVQSFFKTSKFVKFTLRVFTIIFYDLSQNTLKKVLLEGTEQESDQNLTTSG